MTIIYLVLRLPSGSCGTLRPKRRSTTLHSVRILPFHPSTSLRVNPKLFRRFTKRIIKLYARRFSTFTLQRLCSHLYPFGRRLLAATFLTSSFLKFELFQEEIGECPDFPPRLAPELSSDLPVFLYYTLKNNFVNKACFENLIPCLITYPPLYFFLLEYA